MRRSAGAASRTILDRLGRRVGSGGRAPRRMRFARVSTARAGCFLIATRRRFLVAGGGIARITFRVTRRGIGRRAAWRLALRRCAFVVRSRFVGIGSIRFRGAAARGCCSRARQQSRRTGASSAGQPLFERAASRGAGRARRWAWHGLGCRRHRNRFVATRVRRGRRGRDWFRFNGSRRGDQFAGCRHAGCRSWLWFTRAAGHGRWPLHPRLRTRLCCKFLCRRRHRLGLHGRHLTLVTGLRRAATRTSRRTGRGHRTGISRQGHFAAAAGHHHFAWYVRTG